MQITAFAYHFLVNGIRMLKRIRGETVWNCPSTRTPTQNANYIELVTMLIRDIEIANDIFRSTFCRSFLATRMHQIQNREREREKNVHCIQLKIRALIAILTAMHRHCIFEKAQASSSLTMPLEFYINPLWGHKSSPWYIFKFFTSHSQIEEGSLFH